MSIATIWKRNGKYQLFRCRNSVKYTNKKEIHKKYECAFNIGSSSSSNKRNKHFIHIQTMGLEDNTLHFENQEKMTVHNVLLFMRKYMKNKNDDLYLINEQYKNEELLKTSKVQYGRTYICKRRRYK